MSTPSSVLVLRRGVLDPVDGYVAIAKLASSYGIKIYVEVNLGGSELIHVLRREGISIEKYEYRTSQGIKQLEVAQ